MRSFRKRLFRATRTSSATAPPIAVCVIFAFCGHPSVMAVTGDTAFEISTPEVGHQLRVENGRVASWTVQTSDRGKDQVEVFDLNGAKQLSMNPLRSSADATRIAIWDVSVGSSGMVGIAADYSDESGRVSSALLLYSGADGSLLKAFSLPAEREIRKLQVGEGDRIWTLGMGSGAQDPAQVPAIIEYDSSGSVLKQFVPRSKLGTDAVILHEGMRFGGDVSFGIVSGWLWFYLPESRQLTRMRLDGSGLRNVTLPALPTPSSSEVLETLVRVSSLASFDRLVAHVSFREETRNESGLFEWTEATNSWKSLPVGEVSAMSATFVGLKDGELALEFFTRKAPTRRIHWVPLPSE
ncbi:MAG TPA: hypothetical protein VG206_09525 [Terriglobia bacterium]|nr:hypothetical protein [Terriglobia bacterium]